MAVSRRLVRTITITASCVLLVIAGGWYLAIRSVNDAFHAGLESIKTIVKASASNVVAIKRDDKSSAGTYAELYEKDPEKVRATAKISETWYNASWIADEVLKDESVGDWVRRSDELRFMRISQLDAWGHPFCLLRRDKTVAILSAGSKAESSPVCADIPMSAAELNQLPHGRIIETPGGSLVLVMEKKSEIF